MSMVIWQVLSPWEDLPEMTALATLIWVWALMGRGCRRLGSGTLPNRLIWELELNFS